METVATATSVDVSTSASARRIVRGLRSFIVLRGVLVAYIYSILRLGAGCCDMNHL